MSPKWFVYVERDVKYYTLTSVSPYVQLGDQ